MIETHFLVNLQNCSINKFFCSREEEEGLSLVQLVEGLDASSLEFP
jgi:hypothetical protein